MQKLKLAIAGNPNAGKTSVFNGLTGSRQHVGNWPGVTVELKEGELSAEELDLTLVDLPGTYNLTEPYEFLSCENGTLAPICFPVSNACQSGPKSEK